ncbi:hypothetical protein [Natranaerofaba carboxydovora]|uniref:hypothetical protein n=1 Tax=Natranaerofaba carboxydovora TaxID=2742683 RepID=UPI001F14742C|nr:hypothetical protein [Natranaerofaba carboxydovora]UMZ74125.1 hypothetical protein ACONDI_01704 [Natranaerofaba carboxydovora]
MFKMSINIILFSLLILFMFPGISYAYLDPGSGSLIFQMIVAGAAGIAFAVKVFWYRIKQFFGLFRGGSDE